MIDARAFVDEFVEAIRSEDADRYASLYAEEAVMNPSFPGSTSEPPPPSVAPLSRSIAKEKPMKVPTLEEFVSGHEVRPRVALCPCDAGVRARQATTTRTLTFVRVLILALLLAAPLVAAAGARAHGVPTVQATAAWHTFDSLSRLGGVSTSAAKDDANPCTAGERDEALRQDRHAVLAMLSADQPPGPANLTTLESQADLAGLAALGYGIYPHRQTSFGGTGWLVYNPLFDPANSPASTPSAGHPPVLTYEPSGASVYAPDDGFDFPYRLRGWFCLANYEFGAEPLPPLVPRCIGRREWFVHERGLHPFETGGMKPLPPGEDVHGTAPGPPGSEPPPGSPGDLGHTRMWDLHVWLDGDDVPSLSILNPGPPIRGIEPAVGLSPPPSESPPPVFYYPQRAADLAVTQTATRVGQVVTYTITVSNKGPDPATGVTLVDQLPKNATGRAAAASQGKCRVSPRLVICSLGTLPARGSASIDVTVRVNRAGKIANTVSAKADQLELIPNEARPERGWTTVGAERDNTNTIEGTGDGHRAVFDACHQLVNLVAVPLANIQTRDGMPNDLVPENYAVTTTGVEATLQIRR